MRTDGYAPIRDYAVLGDGRTCALVARDGAVDWLCLPDLDSPSTFGALLDARRGGSFTLAPEEPFESERRYLPETNVLETTFRTSEGAVRVTDALTLPGHGLEPLRELARRVEGLAGHVRMRWRAEPRFEYGRREPRASRPGGRWFFEGAGEAVAVSAWGGEGDTFELREGDRALLALTAARGEPLVLPARQDVERRLDETIAFWRRWAGRCEYEGPWAGAVLRSALALKLLVHAPSGAIAAAPTTSLPESIGGERNWDYRFSWIRDSAFVLDALLQLGYHEEAESFLWWVLHASQRTHPELRVLYRLNGDVRAAERTLDLHGYRGSRPVHVGNGAADQLQLGIYGSLLESIALFVRGGHALDRDTGSRIAEEADFVCENWRRTDSGIWEVRSEPVHFTHSKLMCWVALDRALSLAGEHIPAEHVPRWREERRAIQEFLDERCWSEERQSYVRFAGGDELDAALLMGAFVGCHHDERARTTVDAVRRELADGPYVWRYQGEDGLPGEEGAFLTCSFWLVHALAKMGRANEAAELMDELVGLANDVGLYAEEIEPASGDFLGNFPQALTHLALVNAACALREEAT
jgi:GH15 family glucan-1,4-alpha-glucosidase